MRLDILRLMREHKVLLNEVAMLIVLDRMGGTAEKIGDVLERANAMIARPMSASVCTLRVNRLSDIGLIERVEHPTDRVAMQIRLTPLGRSYFRREEAATP